MARQKKDGQFLNCYMRKDLYDRVETYCNETMIPKTAIVEKAVQEYMDKVAPIIKETNEQK